MKIHPILPIWVMAFICIAMLLMKRKGVWNFIRQVLIVALLFTINLRIMVFSYEIEKQELNIDVLFVFDNTMSMLAEDFDGDGRRIDAAKEDCQYIMDKFEGARFGLISFGNRADVMSPYTDDKGNILTSLDTLKGQTKYYADGTSLNMPYEILLNTVKNHANRFEDRVQIVFFLSDGEITEKNEKLCSYSKVEDYILTGAVLGYGTEDGGYMKVSSFTGDFASSEYLMTEAQGSYGKAVSKIDEDNLVSIADDMDVEYYHMEDSDIIRDVVADIEEELDEYSTTGISKTAGYSDTYYWFAIPLIALLIYDLIYYKRRLRE